MMKRVECERHHNAEDVADGKQMMKREEFVLDGERAGGSMVNLQVKE